MLRIGLYPLGSPAGRTDGIEWFGWVLALVGALVCMTGCELYKFYTKCCAKHEPLDDGTEPPPKPASSYEIKDAETKSPC